MPSRAPHDPKEKLGNRILATTFVAEGRELRNVQQRAACPLLLKSLAVERHGTGSCNDFGVLERKQRALR